MIDLYPIGRLAKLNDLLLHLRCLFKKKTGAHPDSIYLSFEQAVLFQEIIDQAGMPNYFNDPSYYGKQGIMGLIIKEAKQETIASIPRYCCIITRDIGVKLGAENQDCMQVDLSGFVK